MNIAYVQSGYPNIYHYFDQTIAKALHVLGESRQDSAFSEQELIQHSHINSHDLILTLLGNNLQTKTITMLQDKNIATAVWLTEDPYFIDDTIKPSFHLIMYLLLIQLLQRYTVKQVIRILIIYR
ncbi:hypothetical protein [Bacillus sp. JCM 19034]|uniref:hypothetical protein n=1 Tax=Bacillus sp. JCM 19034 TaxID=1481928 RepID=UPI0007829DAB|nr:hypothetical protein [Bacillus sp. JCM 19034]